VASAFVFQNKEKKVTIYSTPIKMPDGLFLSLFFDGALWYLPTGRQAVNGTGV
jgi:hypothetical protein